VPFDSDKETVLMYAAIAEKGSEHPLGEAIMKAAQMGKITVPDSDSFEAVPGHGVKVGFKGNTILFGNRRLMETSGFEIAGFDDTMTRLEEQGKTAMLLARNGKVIGIIAVADTLKESSVAAVTASKKEGIEVIMLTGDNERTARAVARLAGIEKVIANVPPGEKAGVIKKLQSEGKAVAMVGDDINDAPALAQADIGIAIGSGSDVAKETGGIILVKDDVRDVYAGIKLSKATMRKIKQNLFWAFAYNTIGIPIAALGFLNPIIAVAAMALSSLSVVANSATLKTLKIEVS